jgi:urease accessory protein
MSLSPSLLLQLGDSALPTGAFAYSNGLEALARAGAFTTPEALEAHLGAYLGQAMAFDLAFVVAAMAVEGEADEETDAVRDPLARLNREWDAGIWNAGIRTASLRQARAFVDLVASLYPRPGLEALRARCGESSADSLHYVVAFGRALALLGADAVEACRLYLHGAARDQAAAAVRLGLIGPRLAQGMQARATGRAMDALGDASRVPSPASARRTAPAVEAGQGIHGFLYSRLFQN